MRRVGWLFVSIFFLFPAMAQGAIPYCNRGMIALRPQNQFLFIHLKRFNRKLYVPGPVIHSRSDVLASKFVRATWSSDRLGWLGDSIAQSAGIIVYADSRTRNDTLVVEIENTLDSDKGQWHLWTEEGMAYLVNPKYLPRNGYSSVILGYDLQYGDYLRPALTISQGSIVLDFNSNGIAGFNRSIDFESLLIIRWESDGEGWGTDSKKQCVPEILENGRLRCIIDGLTHSSDRGNLHAILKDGTDAWFIYKSWDLSPNIKGNDDWTISYTNW